MLVSGVLRAQAGLRWFLVVSFLPQCCGVLQNCFSNCLVRVAFVSFNVFLKFRGGGVVRLGLCFILWHNCIVSLVLFGWWFNELVFWSCVAAGALVVAMLLIWW